MVRVDDSSLRKEIIRRGLEIAEKIQIIGNFDEFKKYYDEVVQPYMQWIDENLVSEETGYGENTDMSSLSFELSLACGWKFDSLDLQNNNDILKNAGGQAETAIRDFASYLRYGDWKTKLERDI